eukprot:11711847-Karenia_brevis.AAC.1
MTVPPIGTDANASVSICCILAALLQSCCPVSVSVDALATAKYQSHVAALSCPILESSSLVLQNFVINQYVLPCSLGAAAGLACRRRILPQVKSSQVIIIIILPEIQKSQTR